MEFVIQNWMLFAALAFITVLLLIQPLREKASGLSQVGPLMVPPLMNKNAQVIDVREAVAFQAGHIKGAVNLPMSELKSKLSEIEQYKNKPIVLSCQSGAKAKQAGLLLLKNQFEQVHVLAGGMAAWQKESLPISR